MSTRNHKLCYTAHCIGGALLFYLSVAAAPASASCNVQSAAELTAEDLCDVPSVIALVKGLTNPDGLVAYLNEPSTASNATEEAARLSRIESIGFESVRTLKPYKDVLLLTLPRQVVKASELKTFASSLSNQVSEEYLRSHARGDIAELRRHLHMERVPRLSFRLQPNLRLKLTAPASEPNDSHYQNGDQWGLARIGAPIAWGRLADRSSLARVEVAVLDSGVTVDSPELGLDQVANTNQATFLGMTADTILPSAADNHGHGSTVASIIGAGTNNAEYWEGWPPLPPDVAAVTWAGGNSESNIARVRPIKIAETAGDPPAQVVGQCVHNLLLALPFAVDPRGSANESIWTLASNSGLPTDVQIVPIGARVINLSAEFIDYIGSIKTALQRIQRYFPNTLLVAAAPNRKDTSTINADEYCTYPTGYKLANVLSVTSIDQDGFLAGTFGRDTVHLAAPGENIIGIAADGSVNTRSGTSFAAPHVSGAAAILMALVPEWTAYQVKSYLLQTSDRRTCAGGPARSRCDGSGVDDVELGTSLCACLENGVLDLAAATAPPVRNLESAAIQWKVGSKVAVTWETIDTEECSEIDLSLQYKQDGTQIALKNNKGVSSGAMTNWNLPALPAGYDSTERHDAYIRAQCSDNELFVLSENTVSVGVQ